MRLSVVSEQLESVHIVLEFNGMLMSVVDNVEQCHKDARFWMTWDSWPKLELFLKMNQLDKVVDKKIFGILVANCIIQLC